MLSKHIEYKKVSNTVINNVYKINELIGNSSNITIEAKLIDSKRFVIDDAVITIFTFEDNTGIINALLICGKEDYIRYKNNNYYKVKGNVVVLDKEKLEDLEQLINKININNYLVRDMKLLCIRSIQHIENKLHINSIELSLYHNNKNDLINIKIPIEAVEVLEVNKITKSLLYLKNGNYDEIICCGCFLLRLLVNKLDKKITKTLLENICIFSIGLYFDNGNKEYYNLPYYSNDGNKNSLQRVNKYKNKIIIHMDEDYKYVFVK